MRDRLAETSDLDLAFGNAKTVKNDNSSRFGKFIRINFDQSGFIAGATIETYLLEKSRAIRQAKDERTFHIFYQFLRGADPTMIKEYHLEDFSRYRYLTHGNVTVADINDTHEFHNTIEAMQIMTMSKDEIDAIFRTLSVVLQMGNMQFKQERNSEQAMLTNDTVAQKICKLLGLPVTDFVQAFLKPKLKVGRDLVTKAQTQTQVSIAGARGNDENSFLSRSISLWKRFPRRSMNACSNGSSPASISLWIVVDDKVCHSLVSSTSLVLKSSKRIPSNSSVSIIPMNDCNSCSIIRCSFSSKKNTVENRSIGSSSTSVWIFSRPLT